MRVESAVTSVSWIPSEAMEGLTKLPFEVGVGHYDAPPPDRIESLRELHRDGAFRFANDLRAWVEVEDGHIVGHGHAGRGYINSTLLRFGRVHVAFQPNAFPDLQSVQDVTETSVRFRQITGGRHGVPSPRRIRGKPYFTLSGPIVWTTLELTIHADGTAEREIVGASGFPRHWLYDDRGHMFAKSGLTDFRNWYATGFGSHSPWGDEDSPVLVSVASTALERELSDRIMRGARPEVRRLARGGLLTEQGQPGHELYLLLDGVLTVEVDGEAVADVGPGAVLGERSVIEGGRRTATLRAVTDCRVAVAGKDAIDPEALAGLAFGHRREDG